MNPADKVPQPLPDELNEDYGFACALSHIMEQLLAQAHRRGFAVYGFAQRSDIGFTHAPAVLIESIEILPPPKPPADPSTRRKEKDKNL